MSVFHEIPPTAGFPIQLKDLLLKQEPGTLEEDFQNYLQVAYAAVTYSGTAAFYFILETLKKLSDKKTVILPSFVCPLVALAVARAGLKIQICDIQKNRFDYDEAELQKICRENNDILAVVAVHLGGIPVDLNAISAVTQKYGIFLVEDCAQSLGAEYHGKKVGTIGDFGFFSLCRGKGLTIYEGGVAVAQAEYVSALAETIRALEKTNFLSEALKIVELFAYAAFYRPFLFWFVFKWPQKFWLKRRDPVRAMGEYADKNFPTHRVSALRKNLGHKFFYHLKEEIGYQRAKALFYKKVFASVKEFFFIAERPGTMAVYPYIVLLADSPQRREKVLKEINAHGLGASIIYVHALPDYDFLQGIVPAHLCFNARYLAKNTLTLSTSNFIRQEDILRIGEIVSRFR